MTHSDGHIKTLDGISLYRQCWLPEAKPKAMLLVVHGFGDHSGRYGNLIHFFLPRGYAVCSFDLRGHGKSDGLRGYSNRFSNFTDDLGIVLVFVQSLHPGLPLFLVGHSTGGTISIAYSISNQNKVTGLILSGVLLSPPDDVPVLKIFAARILSRLAPKTGLYRLNAGLLSRDKKVVEAYITDPLVYWGRVRARMGTELMDAMAFIRERLSQIRLPMLIMHGEADQLSNPEGSRTLYAGAGSSDKTLKLYTGFYHEIYNEPERQQVFAGMNDWLDARLPVSK